MGSRTNKKLSKEEKEDMEDYKSSKDKTAVIDLKNILEKRFKPNKKQQEFLAAMDSSTITVCHGPAGSSKTFSAVAKGLQEVLNSNKRLVLIRPIFESASNKLMALPGSVEEKIAPHYRAFNYTLSELIGDENSEALIEKGKIRFEVLNYLRGATLKNSFILCDEAQNMTVEEMILATTRLGKGSKIVFTGDFFQSDLRKAKGSIMEFADMIKEIDGVSKFTFTNADVVRSKILIEVTKVWEDYKNKIG